jgi:threonine/homoserine efflux transporter RhtA
MCLIIGGLVYSLAPIFLCVSLGLSGRAKVATVEVRRAHVFGVVALAILGVLGTLVVGTDFAGWWRFVGQWALLICWVLLVVTLVIIYRRLKSEPPAPPTYQSPGR